MYNYKELNLLVSPLRNDFQFPKDTGDSHITLKIDVEKSLNPDLIKFFNNLDLNIKAMVFRTPPHNKCSIHVDGFLTHQQWGVNWVWGNDHLMSWWKPNSPKLKLENFKKTNAKTPYLFWDDDDVTLLESVKITKPKLLCGLIEDEIYKLEKDLSICEDYTKNLAMYSIYMKNIIPDNIPDDLTNMIFEKL